MSRMASKRYGKVHNVYVNLTDIIASQIPGNVGQARSISVISDHPDAKFMTGFLNLTKKTAVQLAHRFAFECNGQVAARKSPRKQEADKQFGHHLANARAGPAINLGEAHGTNDTDFQSASAIKSFLLPSKRQMVRGCS